MAHPKLLRLYHPDLGVRLGLQDDDTIRLLPETSLTALLITTVGRVPDAIAGLAPSGETFDTALFDNPPGNDVPHLLAPVDHQDVWASGVTYERSREARQEEAADGGDVYARVYDAERPELFFKAHGRDVIGPLGEVGIRRDAVWSVPEPELAIVVNPAMEVIGFTIGNDMSSRDIEGANPLYLPQAKVYTASCALGDGIVLNPLSEWPQTDIHITIRRDGSAVFSDSVHTSRIKRTIDELIRYLGHSYAFPYGAVLLTGTGVVPPTDFTLYAEDEVEIVIDRIGTLKNRVIVV